jgi:hypothetical protein
MLTPRTTLMLALAALSNAAAAQEMVFYHWSFTEVVANTTIPATGPLAENGVIDPGEGAEIRLSLSFTPAVGTQVSYPPPPGSGQGTVAGLASSIFTFRAPAGSGGTLHNISRDPGWAIGGARKHFGRLDLERPGRPVSAVSPAGGQSGQPDREHLARPLDTDALQRPRGGVSLATRQSVRRD